ncbi:hypothetical protein AMAG_03980 [Allomyces macrogynus ATCC 38327]|uniref:Dol-P-Glc:Glc(2)Man(9)GlcNAc(2)-PP-Dol alpha-1,2-glucosyltransferase n=1 Tax=Allomyces macrogynus (strain ATCC 38327) TaxID=578462 RepID=A0A0L0S7R1_ALLM3|nr:hypothetical protein AMAG_03980 [Allomyces macrogynus ATCC 38327]|eukprot:KNE58404.1 hypothetical protein AMAG_03980 [Allomyces macrogynus ATCC 38327]
MTAAPQSLASRVVLNMLPVVALVLVCQAVCTLVPLPYMDEPFHAVQAQAYCRGDWHVWDSKITTPPGLYAVSLAILRAVAALLPWVPVAIRATVGLPVSWHSTDPVPDFLCSLTALRLTNVLVAALVLGLSRALVRDVARDHAVDAALARAAQPVPEGTDVVHSPASLRSVPDAELRQATAIAQVSSMILAWNALNAWMQPIAVLYYTLYYTEPPSAMLVLATILLMRARWYYLGGFVGFAAMMVRQTNVIWVCFAAGSALAQRVRFAEARRYLRKAESPADAVALPPWMLGICPDFTFGGWLSDHLQFTSAILHRYRAKTVRVLTPAVLAITGGIAAARANGGLVAGDHANHTLALHVPQIMYCAVAIATLTLPLIVTVSDVSAYVVFSLRKLRSLKGFLFMTAVFSVMFAAVHFSTYEHPFVLADNRHLVFYLFKDVIRANALNRYLLVPGYFVCFWFLYRKLAEQQGTLFITIYAVAVALTLVPSPLVEVRYFILPALIYRLHLVETKPWKLAFESILHVAANAAMLYVFLMRPFEWPSEPGVPQRFMW